MKGSMKLNSIIMAKLFGVNVGLKQGCIIFPWLLTYTLVILLKRFRTLCWGTTNRWRSNKYTVSYITWIYLLLLFIVSIMSTNRLYWHNVFLINLLNRYPIRLFLIVYSKESVSYLKKTASDLEERNDSTCSMKKITSSIHSVFASMLNI